MKYKAIDRSNIDFTSDAEICNIGYFEENYQNIPVRGEKFVSNGITCVTIFIPKIDEFDDEEKIKKFLSNNNIIKFKEDKTYITELEDTNDNTFLSINVPLDDRTNIYNECLINFKDYE